MTLPHSPADYDRATDEIALSRLSVSELTLEADARVDALSRALHACDVHRALVFAAKREARRRLLDMELSDDEVEADPQDADEES